MGEPGSDLRDDLRAKAVAPNGVATDNNAAPEQERQQHGEDEPNQQSLSEKLVTETSRPKEKSRAQDALAESTCSPDLPDFPELMLEQPELMLEEMDQPEPSKEAYSTTLNIDGEIERKLSHAPDPIKEFYRGTREGQVAHEAIGLDLMPQFNDAAEAENYKNQWAEMNAWLAFPENYIRDENGLVITETRADGSIGAKIDKDCQEGRELVQQYLKAMFDRKGAAPQGKAKEQDDDLRAKIYSLILNDHDYLHNKDEITIHNGMHHLPETFAGIGINGQSKPFKLREIAKTLMFDTLQNKTQSTIKPDERANVIFYTQVLRQVLPANLLDDAHKAERESILKDYVKKCTLREKDLSAIKPSDLQAFRKAAAIKYPEMAKIKPGLQLMDSEKLYEDLNLTEVRQIEVEGFARRKLNPNLAKDAELTYMEWARLHGISRVQAMMREYREGQTLNEKNYLAGVFLPAGKKYFVFDAKEQMRLRNWPNMPAQVVEIMQQGKLQTVIVPQGIYRDWRSTYWDDDDKLNTDESDFEKATIAQTPDVSQCSISQEYAKLIRIEKSGAFIKTKDQARLNELNDSLCDEATKKTCKHDKSPRLKPGDNSKPQ